MRLANWRAKLARKIGAQSRRAKLARKGGAQNWRAKPARIVGAQNWRAQLARKTRVSQVAKKEKVELVKFRALARCLAYLTRKPCGHRR